VTERGVAVEIISVAIMTAEAGDGWTVDGVTMIAVGVAATVAVGTTWVAQKTLIVASDAVVVWRPAMIVA
jgi:hypothetical protein